MSEFLLLGWITMGATGLLAGAAGVRVAAWRMRHVSPLPAQRSVDDLLNPV